MILRDSYLISAPVRTAYEWVNPAAYGLVVVTSSEGRNLPYGRLEDILSRDSSALNCHTNDDKNAWFAVDLGLWVIPSAYTLRHARYENKHTQGQNKRTSIFRHFRSKSNTFILYYIPSVCLFSLRGYGRSALRNWVFQVSKDGQNWTTLYTHVDDCSLNEPGYDTISCDTPSAQNSHQYPEFSSNPINK